MTYFQRVVSFLFRGKPNLNKVLEEFTVTMTELERVSADRRETEAKNNEKINDAQAQFGDEMRAARQKFETKRNELVAEKRTAAVEAEKAEAVRDKIADLIGEGDTANG